MNVRPITKSMAQEEISRKTISDQPHGEKSHVGKQKGVTTNVAFRKPSRRR